MLRFGHLGLSFLEHGFGDTAKFLSVPHLRDSIYVEKVQGSTSIPWGHLWPKHYNIDWRSTTRVSVSCLFSPESRLRLMKVHVSTWTDQQGHQALRMVQARLFSPGTWFWHIFYRNCGIEYTLRSEIRWRCYQNNNFTAAKMLINHSIFGYFPMLRHAWKNAHPGFGHRRCVVSLHVSAMRRCFFFDCAGSLYLYRWRCSMKSYSPAWASDSYGAQCQAISRRTSNIGHLQPQSLLVTLTHVNPCQPMSTHVNPCQPMTAKNFLFFNR